MSATRLLPDAHPRRILSGAAARRMLDGVMNPEHAPEPNPDHVLREHLNRLAAERLSGRCEIVTHNERFVLELRAGYLVWAERSPGAFARLLRDRLGLSDAMLQAAVSHALEGRHSVGHALVSLGMVDHDAFESAVRDEVGSVIAAVRRCSTVARCLTVRHRGREAHGFGWSVEEAWEASSAHLRSDRRERVEQGWVLSAVAELVPEALWVASVGADARVGAFPAGAAVPTALLEDAHQSLEREEGSVMVVRGAAVSMIGVREAGGSLWCAIPASASAMGALRQLDRLAAAARGQREPHPPVAASSDDALSTEVVSLAGRLGKLLSRHRTTLAEANVLPSIGFLRRDLSLFGEPAPERPGVHRWCAFPGIVSHHEACAFLDGEALEDDGRPADAPF